MTKFLLSILWASLPVAASAQVRAIRPGASAPTLRGVILPTAPGFSASLPTIAGAMSALTPVISALPAAAPEPTALVLAAAPKTATDAEQPAASALAHLERSAASSGDEFRGPFSDGARQFDGAFASYRAPTYVEQSKIDESLRRGAQSSLVARDLIREFLDQGGRFAIDPDAQAAYHGKAFLDRYDRPTVALTQDTISNGSWAFILATIGREIMNFNGWYQGVPASAERLAIQYAHMALIFAEATNGSARAWSTNLDHNHRNEGTYFVWAWYEKLLQAVTSTTTGFIESDYFIWLRDFVARQTASNPSHQYSLYEQLTGRHYRPGTAIHDTPIPSDIPRLTQAQHDAASSRVYGEDGNGDNNANANLLGYLRGWFYDRGNK